MSKNKVNYRLTEGLTQDQIKHMHQKALEIIEEIGLEVRHKQVLKRLTQYRGVKVDKNRVRFESWLVDKYVMNQSYSWEKFSHNYVIVSGAYEQNVLDLNTRKIRPATLTDLVDFTKLADSYGMVGAASVRPMDIPIPLQEIAMHKVCWENSAHKAEGILDATPKSSLEIAQYVYEMAQVANKSFTLGIWINSPFQIASEELDIVYYFLDKKVPLWVATMPIAGATAPISILGAYVQSMAELFAGYTLLKLLSPESYVFCSIIDSIRAYLFDMKYGNFVYGSPEDIWGTTLQVQLNRYYGIPIIAKSLLTASPLPDAHAAAEKSSHTIVAALAGVDGFTNAGLLAVDDIYSAEQVVIDYEIVEYAKHFVKSFSYSEKNLSVEAIKEIGLKKENFLTYPETLKNFRSEFWIPNLFEHYTLRQWQDKGSLSVQDRAREIAKKRIAAHQFELNKEVKRELDSIYKKACKDLI